jgi:hypothetical protein
MTSRSIWEPRDPDVIGAAVSQLLDALELDPCDVVAVTATAVPPAIELEVVGGVTVSWPMTIPLPEAPA